MAPSIYIYSLGLHSLPLHLLPQHASISLSLPLSPLSIWWGLPSSLSLSLARGPVVVQQRVGQQHVVRGPMSAADGVVRTGDGVWTSGGHASALAAWIQRYALIPLSLLT